jgi:hypothetical protein
MPLICFLPSFALAAERDIVIKVNAAEPSRLTEVRQTQGAKEETLSLQPPWEVPVRITEAVIFDNLTFTATGDDGTKTSVHLNVHSSLTRPPYQVHLVKPTLHLDRLDQEIRTRCHGFIARELKDAFEQMHTCRAYTLHVQGSETDPKADRYLKALHGWYQGNHYLYRLVVPVSLYALDADLVTRLRDLVESGVSQTILRPPDVLRTLVEFETQMVRLAASVLSSTGDQADQIRIAACRELSELKYSDYFRIVHKDTPKRIEQMIGIAPRHREALGLGRCAN